MKTKDFLKKHDLVRETPSHHGSKVWDLLTDERSKRVVEVAEAYADGKATSAEMKAARDDAYSALDDAAIYASHAVAHAAAFAASVADAIYASRATAYAAAYAESVAKRTQVKLIAELGNPFVTEK